MAIKLYMDHHVAKAITNGLRLRQVDVLTAAEDGAATLSDPKLLDRATALGRVLFSQDDDLLVEATRRQEGGVFFAGVVFARQSHVPIGVCVHELELIALVFEPVELQDTITYLPL
jgi:hypothetical protein